MKSAYICARNKETNAEVHQIITFDETQKCLLCGQPVGQLSTGGSAICGRCDMGRTPPHKMKHYEKGEMPNVWCNVKEHWEFPTREEAEKKMYELHLAGIPGWDHIINKFTERANWIDMNGSPISLAWLVKIMTVLDQNGEVHVTNCAKFGPHHISYLLNLMKSQLSDQDKQWFVDTFKDVLRQEMVRK